MTEMTLDLSQIDLTQTLRDVLAKHVPLLVTYGVGEDIVETMVNDQAAAAVVALLALAEPLK
jgi:hypothetical protein